jgi:AcrR family transcriptional regulator
MDLLQATGNVDFTVQNIVDESQLSLRSFYQHFGGKDELLLAIYAEFICQFADDMRQDLEGIDDPVAKLESYTRGFLHRIHSGHDKAARSLNIYTMRLAADRPDDYRRALTPQVRLLTSVLQDGVARGVFRSDLEPAAMAVILHSALVAAAQIDVFTTSATGDAPFDVDEMWSWCRSAVQAPSDR